MYTYPHGYVLLKARVRPSNQSAGFSFVISILNG